MNFSYIYYISQLKTFYDLYLIVLYYRQKTLGVLEIVGLVVKSCLMMMMDIVILW